MMRYLPRLLFTLGAAGCLAACAGAASKNAEPPKNEAPDAAAQQEARTPAAPPPATPPAQQPSAPPPDPVPESLDERLLKEQKAKVNTLEANLKTAKKALSDAQCALIPPPKAPSCPAAPPAGANTRAELAEAELAVYKAQSDLDKARERLLELELRVEKQKEKQQEEKERASAPKKTSPEKVDEVEFARHGRLRYGLSLSLVRVAATRDPAEPARLRDYRVGVDTVPAEIGFQFTHMPSGGPWRLRKKDRSYFQLMSWGGLLLLHPSTRSVNQSSISLGATLNFFENLVGIGIGFDLYRGIPVRDANGTEGGDTAGTGILSWAFTPKGEVTPENVFVVLSLGLDPIVKAFSGEAK